jgi:hypothetical protein
METSLCQLSKHKNQTATQASVGQDEAKKHKKSQQEISCWLARA